MYFVVILRLNLLNVCQIQQYCMCTHAVPDSMKCLQDRLWQFYQRLEADATCICKKCTLWFRRQAFEVKPKKDWKRIQKEKVRGAGRGKEMCNSLPNQRRWSNDTNLTGLHLVGWLGALPRIHYHLHPLAFHKCWVACKLSMKGRTEMNRGLLTR